MEEIENRPDREGGEEPRRLEGRADEAPPQPGPDPITLLLDAVHRGEKEASPALLQEVYLELRRVARAKMAMERPGQTLQPTALVHEAWLRLVDQDGQARFESRAHFFGAAAEAMRRILVEAARRKRAARRGGGQGTADLDALEIAAPGRGEDVLAVDEALEKLTAHDPEKAKLVKLRYFTGLSIEETAAVMGVSARTIKRHWAYSRAWLLDVIRTE